MRKSPLRRKICIVSDELLLRKHLWLENDDCHGDQVWCGANTNWFHKHDECVLTPEETNCYTCLDNVIALAKKCAERLTELPPRVS